MLGCTKRTWINNLMVNIGFGKCIYATEFELKTRQLCGGGSVSKSCWRLFSCCVVEQYMLQHAVYNSIYTLASI